MNDEDAQRMIRLLEEIRDGQRLQLERQSEAIAQQKERLAAIDQARSGAQAIRGRSDQAIDRAERLIDRARFTALVIVPVLIVLLVFVSWAAFSRR